MNPAPDPTRPTEKRCTCQLGSHHQHTGMVIHRDSNCPIHGTNRPPLDTTLAPSGEKRADLAHVWNFDTEEGFCWKCPDCESWASLGGNAAFHAQKSGHGTPLVAPIQQSGEPDACPITASINPPYYKDLPRCEVMDGALVNIDTGEVVFRFTPASPRAATAVETDPKPFCFDRCPIAECCDDMKCQHPEQCKEDGAISNLVRVAESIIRCLEAADYRPAAIELKDAINKVRNARKGAL